MTLLVVGTLLFAGAAFLVIQVATLPARQRRDVVKRVADYGSQAIAQPLGVRRQTRARNVFDPIWSVLAAPVLLVLPRTTRESVDKRLIAAGLAPRVTPDQALGAKALFAAIGVVIGLLFLAQSTTWGILFTLCLAPAGFFLPDVFINSRINERRDKIQASLPDALDLLAVSVEAGLSFDAGVAKLVEYLKGPLVEEFALMLNEIRIGTSRAEGLRRLEARIDVSELTSFVRAVIQAEELGTSMADILRAQAEDARVNRQLAAEEKAMKLPVKMLIPMAGFILPATFFVLLGSAILNLGKNLS
jgi:tight adherence protein C